jgi:hypothetical protein
LRPAGAFCWAWTPSRARDAQRPAPITPIITTAIIRARPDLLRMDNFLEAF